MQFNLVRAKKLVFCKVNFLSFVFECETRVKTRKVCVCMCVTL